MNLLLFCMVKNTYIPYNIILFYFILSIIDLSTTVQSATKCSLLSGERQLRRSLIR